MASNKIILGEYIRQCDIRNTDNEIKSVKGISVKKEFREPTSKVNRNELKSYKVVFPNQFAAVPTTHNEKCFAFAYNDSDEPYVVSSINTVFEVDEKFVDPYWLKMFFNSNEFDRYARFNSWGSAREVFSWDELCSVQLNLPSLSTQQKYSKIYKALLVNQKNYERGLDDLKLVCDGFIEDLKRNMISERIGDYLSEEKDRNKDLQVLNIKGVSSDSDIGETRADTNGLDFSNYKIVKNNCFVYNPSRINLGSIALYKSNENCIVSPMYCVFSIADTSKILPEYLMMWFLRREFQRSTLFYAVGSVRDTFDFSLMQEVKIPIPSIEIQKSIVDIYNCYNERNRISSEMKTIIKDICPILIRGSIVDS